MIIYGKDHRFNAQCTVTNFFVGYNSDKKLEWTSDFLMNCFSENYLTFFIADQKSDFPWYFYGSNISFSAHVPIFIGVIVLRQLHLWIMSLYIVLMDWSWRTRSNYLSQTNYLIKRLDFLSDSQLVRTILFSLQFLSMIKKLDRVRWT